jgi:hypothetical protein
LFYVELDGEERLKYKAKTETCSTKGCGGKPRKGQRDCKECHRLAMKAYRRKRSGRNPMEVLDRIQLHLAQRIGPKLPRAEFKGLQDARAILVAAQMDVFNAGGRR